MMDGSLKHDDIHRTGSKQRIATPPEEDRAATVVTLHRKFGEDRTCGFYDMTDKHTDRQTDRQTRSSQNSAPLYLHNTIRQSYGSSVRTSDRNDIQLLLKKVKYAIPHEECKQGAHLPFLGLKLVGG